MRHGEAPGTIDLLPVGWAARARYARYRTGSLVRRAAALPWADWSRRVLGAGGTASLCGLAAVELAVLTAG